MEVRVKKSNCFVDVIYGQPPNSKSNSLYTNKIKSQTHKIPFHKNNLPDENIPLGKHQKFYLKTFKTKITPLTLDSFLINSLQ